MNYAELHTLTPALGHFVVTGMLEEVEQAAKSFRNTKRVRSSTFDRVAAGLPRRKFSLIF